MRRSGGAARVAATALIAALTLACAMPAAAISPESSIRREFAIGRQPLASALLQLSRQGNVDILAPEALTRGRTAPHVRGLMTAEQALSRMLGGTDLGYRAGRDGSLILELRPPPPQLVRRSDPPRPRPVPVTMPPDLSMEQIIVTAQRRAERIQRVPVSLTAFKAEALAQAGIRKIMDLQQVDTSLTLSAQSGVVIPFLRGVGNPASSTPANESSVPIYIDDVYYARLYPVYLTLNNVDRVEVLKGPQGTLFGRNVTGGLIQIFTREPGPDPTVDMTLGYGSHQTLEAKLYASTTLGEKAAIDFAASGRDMGKGFGRNIFSNVDTYYTKYYNFRSKLIIRPTETTKLRLSAFYVYQNASIGEVQGAVYPGYVRGLPPDYSQAFVPPAGFHDLNTDHPSFHHHRGFGGSLKLDQELGFADFASISFYRSARETWHSEGDLTYVPELAYVLHTKDSQITQEFQLKSVAESRVAWIMGLFYLRSRQAIEPTSISGDAISRKGMDSLNLVGRQTINSLASFGQATVPVLDDATHLTLGLRYTTDRVKGFGQQYALVPGQTARVPLGTDLRDGRSFDKLTYRLALDRRLSDGVMAYVSVSRGYKSGTFNTIPLDSPPLRPETVDAYEAGIKAMWLDNRVRFNLAIFENDIRNPQVQLIKNIAGVATNLFSNADKARTRGVEFDTAARVAAGLTLRASGQYLDARFIRFLDAPINTPLFVPPYGVITRAGDASGNRMPQTPRTKLNLGFNYEIATSAGGFVLDGNMSYRGSFRWEPDNVVTEPALTLFSGSLSYQPAFSDRLSLRLWGQNLTNEKYFSNMLTQSGPVGFMASPAEPRTYGIEIRYKL